MPAYTVAQNTSFMTAASVLQKVISFAYFTLIARYIGIEGTGQYFFAITFTTIFVVLADFGFAPVLTRETAREPDKSSKYLNTIVSAKLLFGLVAYLLVIVFANLLNYPSDTKALIYLSGVTMFFDNLHTAYYSIFRARGNLRYESYSIIGSQFITLIIGTIALFNGWPLAWLIAAYTFPSALNFVYAAYFARRVYNLQYRISWDREVFKHFFRVAIPFALASFVGRLYAYSDSLIMSKILPREALGLWSVPYKITYAFQFLATSLTASVYPVFSNLYVNDRQKIGELFEKSWRYLFTIVFPLSLGLIAIARPAIVILYGNDYAPAVVPFRILLISLIFGFLSFVTGALLNAVNKQKTQTILMSAALLSSIILNLLLLPVYGIIGAAIAALVGNFILCAWGYYLSAKSAALNHRTIFISLNRILWPAAVMAVIAYALSFRLHFVLVSIIGAVIYFALLFLTGGMTREMVLRVLIKIGYFKK